MAVNQFRPLIPDVIRYQSKNGSGSTNTVFWNCRKELLEDGRYLLKQARCSAEGTAAKLELPCSEHVRTHQQAGTSCYCKSMSSTKLKIIAHQKIVLTPSNPPSNPNCLNNFVTCMYMEQAHCRADQSTSGRSG